MGTEHDAIRFAIGSPDGSRSTTWRVFSGSDSSVYIAPRSIAGHFKASLHTEGGWRVAFKHYDELRRIAIGPPPATRAVDAFPPTPEIAPGVRRAFTVVIPWLAVTVPRHGRPENGAVHWLPPLAEGDVLVAYLVLTAPQVPVAGWPGARSMGTNLIGNLTLADESIVWVVSQTRKALPAEREHWTGLQARMAQTEKAKAAVTDDSNIRGIFAGTEPTDGSRWFLDLPIPVESESIQRR